MRIRGYVSVIVFSLALAVGIAAQQQPEAQAEPSFDVALHLIVGSNDAARGDLPSDLSGVAKQIKNGFGFSNYRLTNTFFGRITNGGSFEYHSINNLSGQPAPGERQTFLEWSLGDFRVVPTRGGQGAQARAFRFGARVPVIVDGNNTVTYEPIGVNVGKFVVAQNTPTLIGTLNMPGTSGTIFLVMTVRSAD